MIVRLDKKQQREARHKLLADVVYIICQDALKGVKRDGKTELEPVEVFLSAKEFCDTVLALPDIDKGIGYEIDDLEEEAERLRVGDGTSGMGENDALLVLVVATVQLQAMSKRRVGIYFKKIILRIFEHLDGKELLWTLIEQMTDKEEKRWIEGKRTDLLNYELQEIELEGGGSEEIKKLFEDFVGYADKMGETTIKEMVLFLERYNIDHNHAYDKELIALFEKLGIKSTTVIQPKEYVATKYVDTEIQNVEAGGIGVTKSNHKDR